MRRHTGPVAGRTLLLTLMATAGLLASCSSGGETATDHTTATATGRATTSTPRTTTTAEVTTTVAPPPDIRSLDLRSGTYRVPCPLGGPETEIHPAQATSPTPEGNVVIESFDPVFGDVTGDGIDDAVIAVNCAAQGGNAVVSSVILVISETGGLRQVGPPIDGYAPKLVGSTLGVARAVYAADDPMCCPSSVRYVPLRFSVDHLAETTSRAPMAGSTATTTGVGGLQVGQPYSEVAARVRRAIVVSGVPDASSGCATVTVEGVDGLSGLGDLDRLHSVEIDDPAIRTRSDLGIGSTAQQVRAAFPGRVSATAHQYLEKGQYLTYRPSDAPDHVAVFDTDAAGKVVHYRVGEPDWASAVEGCL